MNPDNTNRYTELAMELRELYDAHIAAGFTEEQTIKLMESMTHGMFWQIRQENEWLKRRIKHASDSLRARQQSTEAVSELMTHV